MKNNPVANFIFKLFNVVLILLLVIFVVSNNNNITVGMWPFPGGLDTPLFLLTLIAIAVGFIFGLLYSKLNNNKD